MNNWRHKYTREELIQAVAESKSIRQTLDKLGIVPAGGNYQTIKRRIAKENLDTTHFTGMLWNKGQTIPPKKSIEEYLCVDSPITVQSSRLRKRLVREGLKEDKCESCGIIDWLDKPLNFHLHHKDGNHDDNRLENLKILCPNCHSQTKTYGRIKG